MTISNFEPRFVGREPELKDLLAISQREGAQFVIVYGRRRIGKTTLLLKWGERAKLPTIYWVGVRANAATLRQEFAQAVWRTLSPGTPPPTFDTWEAIFENIVSLANGRRVLLILDEFPWMMEADSSLASRLQKMWDHLLKKTNLIIVLAGSHIGMMARLFEYQSALYGRFTAQLHVKPLPFSALTEFLPRYDIEKRVAIYAVVGGVPAYLERIQDRRSLADNLKDEIMSPTGIFRNEPFFLISDQVREARNYIEVIRAIGRGNHTLEDISTAAQIPKHQVIVYLGRLQDLEMVERRLPATVLPAKRTRSHQGRYHLFDHYHRFHFRFIDPNLHLLEEKRYQQVWQDIETQFRAFIGMTAFEELCREWVWHEADRRGLSFMPEIVGSHWGRGIQIDVVAVNWKNKQILLGEAKWQVDKISAKMLKEFVEKTNRFVEKEFVGWAVELLYFARGGYTEATRAEASTSKVRLVDLKELADELGK
jgi:AAA+ ATPase superfamily predicted ATPase